MKILITGASAQHYSSAVAQRSLTYAGMLADAARELGHDVTQVEPSVVWKKGDLDAYDKVFVGVATPISVSANGTYGALNVISCLKDSEKLALFIDVPEPGKIFAGLRAIEKDPNRLFKPFYSRRSGYRDVVENDELVASILAAVEFLLAGKWPKTLWPTLPWYEEEADVVGVKNTVRDCLIGMSFDSAYIRQPGVEALQAERKRAWGVDIPSTRWARSVSRTLSLPRETIKDRKHMSGEELDKRISSLHGVVLTIHDDKRPWWSPFFVKALCAGTPILTEWKYAQKIGDAWSVLGGAIEGMNKVDAYELSVYQTRQYLDKIQARQEVLTTLRQVIGSK